MSPAADQAPVEGSNSSADAMGARAVPPPATSTRPSFRSTAVCSALGSLMLPVAVHAPDAGSYISADVSNSPRATPPATSTLPSWSRVAV